MTVVYVGPKPPNRIDARALLQAMWSALPSCRRKKKHPDGDRQRTARRKSLERREARKLKAQYVPLCFVDPTIYLCEYEPWGYDGPYRLWRRLVS